MKGIEPLTPSLPWKCSTPELHRPLSYVWSSTVEAGLMFIYNLKSANKSGRRDSNPRHSAWKADALPTELLPLASEC